MSYLGLTGKTFVVFGVANKKSVAFAAARLLESEGARVIYSVHTADRRERIKKFVPSDAEILVCDVAEPQDIQRLGQKIAERAEPIAGFVHSIAFANYEGGFRPFHETSRTDFLQAVQISCHSLVEIANALKPSLAADASAVTISISTTTMAAENYGYMAPIKAALDSSVVFLAKSFSAFSNVRFNAVCPGLLKTASSAGIPGYVDSYLFAERATLRKRGVETKEVADAVVFLLSHRSSAINAQRLVLDAGMSANYFDRNIVTQALREME